jgi:hypothetical protein
MTRVHKTDEHPAPDERYVYMRSEDRSIWMRSAFWIEKYKLLWVPLLAILTAMGFGWRTPAQTTHELRETIESTRAVLQRQVDTIRSTVQSGEQTRGRLESKLNVLLKLSCSDPRIARRDKQLAGLECPDVLR